MKKLIIHILLIITIELSKRIYHAIKEGMFEMQFILSRLLVFLSILSRIEYTRFRLIQV